VPITTISGCGCCDTFCAGCDLTTLPTVLFATISDVSNCGCLVGTYELNLTDPGDCITYDAILGISNAIGPCWVYEAPAATTCNFASDQRFIILFQCVSNGGVTFLRIAILLYGLSYGANATSVICSPLVVDYSPLNIGSFVGCCCIGSVNITVTT
jgi:hypothetical protein